MSPESQRGHPESVRRPVFVVSRFEAVIFDMDGVVTDTAQLHSRCWKRVFDEFLRARSPDGGDLPRMFTDEDYLLYVDGKPRYDGVESFLSSRQVELERGEPSDPPGSATVCALGNLKDLIFGQAVEEDGVNLFESTVGFIRSVRSCGLRTALISSSRHAKAILKTLGATNLFDAIVDGLDAEALKLPGKPDPAIFLTAGGRLGLPPVRVAVVEDALAGVEAGQRGGFGLVIGIDRHSHSSALTQHGADVVVRDLSELDIRTEST